MVIIKLFVAGKKVKLLNYSESMYMSITKKLIELSDKQNNLKQEIGHLDLMFSDRLSQLEGIFRDKLKKNKEQELRLNAFIDIAKAHATKLEDNGESEAYDTSVLSRSLPWLQPTGRRVSVPSY